MPKLTQLVRSQDFNPELFNLKGLAPNQDTASLASSEITQETIS